MHVIGKEFGFDYGHRVWTQELNTEYSLDDKCVCRHLHGHRGKLIVNLSGDVQENGMVTDFKHLNWMKQFLDDVLDHKMILDINDPALPELFPNLYDGGKYPMLDVKEIEGAVIETVNPQMIADAGDAMREILEGLVFVDFVPTSENLCTWLFRIAKEKMAKIGITVHSVNFFETPKSQCTYS